MAPTGPGAPAGPPVPDDADAAGDAAGPPGEGRAPGAARAGPGARGTAGDDRSGPGARDIGRSQLERLGRLIRDQRRLAEMSLRELAARTNVSNPYLSQIERGLHEPSLRVLRSIAKALGVSAETLLVQAGLVEGSDRAEAPGPVPAAIAGDERLSDEQKAALLAVYRTYVPDRP